MTKQPDAADVLYRAVAPSRAAKRTTWNALQRGSGPGIQWLLMPWIKRIAPGGGCAFVAGMCALSEGHEV